MGTQDSHWRGQGRTTAEVRAHGAAAADYMLAAQRPDGLFTYELDVAASPRPPDPTNWMDGQPSRPPRQETFSKALRSLVCTF